MQGLAIGVGVAALVVGAYFIGIEVAEEQTDGPVEQLGEPIDRSVNDLEGAIEDGADDVERATDDLTN